jgi:hypothetical protein
MEAQAKAHVASENALVSAHFAVHVEVLDYYPSGIYYC